MSNIEVVNVPKKQNRNARQSEPRDVKMDILRILLILMVITLHYNNRGMGGALRYAELRENPGIVLLFVRWMESLAIPAVNCFVILSGFFSYRNVDRDGTLHRKVFSKAVWLVLATIAYQVLGYILHAVLVLHSFSVRSLIGSMIPENWYVILFVTLLLLSPYLNKLVEVLSFRELERLVILLLLLFSLLPSIVMTLSYVLQRDVNGLSTISASGELNGFSIVNFVLCYLIGAFLGRGKAEGKLRKGLCLPGWCYGLFYLLCSITITWQSYWYETAAWSYANIRVVLASIFLVLAFAGTDGSRQMWFEIPGVIQKAVSIAAGSSLGVYVYHMTPVMLYGLWIRFQIARLQECTLLGAFWNLLSAVFVMFIASLGCVVPAGMLGKKLRRLYEQILSKRQK